MRMKHLLRSTRQAGLACSLALALGVSVLGAAPALAGDASGLTLSDTWMRVIVPSRPAAGYFTLTNGSGETRTLVGASSPACGMVMLHESKGDKMVMLPEVAIAAGESVSFAPRGKHLMCMKPAAELKPGTTAEVTLKFKDGSTLTGSFDVKGATATGN